MEPKRLKRIKQDYFAIPEAERPDPADYWRQSTKDFLPEALDMIETLRVLLSGMPTDRDGSFDLRVECQRASWPLPGVAGSLRALIRMMK